VTGTGCCRPFIGKSVQLGGDAYSRHYPSEAKTANCAVFKSVLGPEENLLRFVSKSFRKIIRFPSTMETALFPRLSMIRDTPVNVFSRQKQRVHDQLCFNKALQRKFLGYMKGRPINKPLCVDRAPTILAVQPRLLACPLRGSIART